MLSYALSDNNHYFVSLKNLNYCFKKATCYISQELKIKEHLHFDVSFVDIKQIQKLNYEYRHFNKPTDVLSFGFKDLKLTNRLLGEIFICYPIAKKQTKATINQEILMLFIHGLLHLLKYDHHNKVTTKKMFDFQNKVINFVNLLE
jgi:probable rRNA maturation factor